MFLDPYALRPEHPSADPVACTLRDSISLSLSLSAAASIIKFESTYRREYGFAREPPHIAPDYFREFMSFV